LIFGTKFAKCVVTNHNQSINQHFLPILQMLCRYQKSSKVSGIGHLFRPAGFNKTWVMCAFWVSMCCALTPPSFAQSENSPGGTVQQTIDAQLRPWYAGIERVNESSINIAPLDSRLKIAPCEKPLEFDFPFVTHKTVRVRCSSPQWQHYLQVTVSSAQASNQVPVVATTAPKQPTVTDANQVVQAEKGSQNTLPSLAQGSSPTAQNQPQATPAARATPSNPGMHTVLISSQFLKRGTILEPSMFTGTEVAFTPSESSALSNPKDVAYMELLRDLPANTPLKSFDIKPMIMIKKGQQVLVSIGEGKGFVITVRAESLQDGQLGDQIKLKNTESGRSISAVVTGMNTAKTN
jgi:flagella basal body P-ring formation protein FlgA